MRGSPRCRPAELPPRCVLSTEELEQQLQKSNARFIMIEMEPINEAASLMGRRSAEARIKQWGKREFVKRMQEWGRLGGRPKGSGKKRTKGAAK